MNELYEQALKYRAFGWNVLPLLNHTKSMIPGLGQRITWIQWKDTKPTDEEFKKLFEAKDITGLALITGKTSNVTVIDYDQYQSDAPRVVLSSSMQSKTASGGYHYFYQYLPGLEEQRIPGLEIKNATIIVLPPSQALNKNGKIGTYEWIKKSTKLTPFPQGILRFFAEKEHITQSLTELLTAPQGMRHTNLLSAANKLFFKFDEKDWGLIEDVLRGSLAKFNPPYTTPKELGDAEQILKDAKAYALKKKIPSYQQGSIKETAPRTPPIIYSQKETAEILQIKERPTLPVGLLNMDSLFTFPSGYYVVCGSPGAGKGWFAIWLARRFFTLHNQKSVFFSLEMGEQLVRERLLQAWSDLTEKQYKAHPENTKQAIALMRQDAITIDRFGEEDTSYQTPENFVKDFTDYYEKGYRIFMFDHLHELEGATTKDDNFTVVEKWGKTFQTLAKKYRDIWLIIFGQPNSAAETKSIIRKVDFYGSKSITQKCEYFISINRPLVKNPETGEISINNQSREVIFWIDKNRITSKQQEGRRIYLSLTGNFTERENEDVQGEVTQLQVDKLTLAGFPNRRDIV